jgi:integrase
MAGNRTAYKICHHRATNRAYIWTGAGSRRRIYLGDWDGLPSRPSKEVREKFDAVVAKIALGEFDENPKLQISLTVADLVDRFLSWAEGRYSLPRQAKNLGLHLRELLQLFGNQDASSFGPRRLKEVREAMAANGRTRQGINNACATIRQCFRWGVEEEFVKADQLQAIEAVSPLRKGATKAPESAPKADVPLDVVKATIPYLSPTVSAMVKIQLLTGMRSGEVCAISMDQIDTSDHECWVYRPRHHKTASIGRIREVPFIPEAIAILMGFLREDDKPLFNPGREIERWQIETRKRKSIAMINVRDMYGANSYRQAIVRGCARVRAKQEGEGLEPSHPDWSPRQLRKAAAQEALDLLGDNSARALLGHRSSSITMRHYARRDLIQARAAALAIAPKIMA